MHYHVYLTRKQPRVTEYLGVIDLSFPSGADEITFDGCRRDHV